MVFENLCFVVLRKKVASALEGLNIMFQVLLYLMPDFRFLSDQESTPYLMFFCMIAVDHVKL